MNKEIILQLDHINGINNDNRIENLRFLCPNCHSQTETYTGKNTEGVKKNACIDCGKEISTQATRCKSCASKLQPNKRPDKDTFMSTLIENKYNLSKVGRAFNVSDNAIRK
jgi:DNA-directed RNA polymerase subunit RPC12/RpoP